MKLLIFDFVTNYYSQVSSSGFNFWTLFNSIVGSFLGFLGAFYLFRAATARDEKKELKIRERNFNDKVKYFSGLLLDIPLIIKTQAQNYTEFAKKMSDEPYNMHTSKFVLKTNLSRLTEKLNQEDYFLAYVNQFKDDEKVRKEEIKKFKTIYSKLDKYDSLLNQSFESIKEFKSKGLTERESFRNQISEAELQLYSAIKDVQLQNPVVFTSLSTLFEEYFKEKQTNQNNLTYFYDKLVVAFRKQFLDNNLSQMESVHRVLTMFRNISITFRRIELISLQQAKEFTQYTEDLLSDFNEFEGQLDQIKKWQ